MLWRDERQVRRMAKDLRLPRDEAWSIEAIAHRVKEITGEDIRFVSAPSRAVSGWCGARTRSGGVNTLYLPSETGNIGENLTIVQEITAAHEMAHVVLKHTAVSSANAALLDAALRKKWPSAPSLAAFLDVDDQVARKQEAEAEVLAALILRHAKPPSRVGVAVARYEHSKGTELNELFGTGLASNAE